MFLLSKAAWCQTAFDSDGNNTYKGSTLQTSLLEAAKNRSNFSESEQTAILQTTKDSASIRLNNIDYNDSELANDTLFALSANELQDYLGYTDQSNTWTVGLGGTIDWWLQSASSNDTNKAGVVYRDGLPAYHNVYILTVWVRAAFNLNLNSVLFTSAAEGGKLSGIGALHSISGYDGDEWKLTLKDSSRDQFAIGTTAVNGNTLIVAYSGATAGTNEYVSAIVTDENKEITYYGRIKNTTSSKDASGTVQITLPDDFNSTTDTLHLFSEQYNGDKNTDYVSELKAVFLTPNAYTVINHLTNIKTDNLNSFCLMSSDYTAVLSVSGDYVLPKSITITVGGKTLTAGTDYTYSSTIGALKIDSTAIDGNIVITASAALSDIAAPSVTATAGGESYASGSCWVSEDVVITVSGSSAPSGIAKYQYFTDSGASWTD